MLGAIAGDIIGSVYEHRPIKSKTSRFSARVAALRAIRFCRWTGSRPLNRWRISFFVGPADEKIFWCDAVAGFL